MDFMPLIFVFGVISDRGLSWEEKECVLKIYKDYRLYIRKTVSQRIQDQHDVEDVIQDCYLQLTKYIDRLIQLDTPQLTRYVFRVIDSCCNNYWLKKKVMVEYSDALLNQPIENTRSSVSPALMTIDTKPFARLWTLSPLKNSSFSVFAMKTTFRPKKSPRCSVLRTRMSTR